MPASAFEIPNFRANFDNSLAFGDDLVILPCGQVGLIAQPNVAESFVPPCNVQRFIHHADAELATQVRGIDMPVGTVKWFDCKKGFGFIVNQAGQDVFVHFSSIQGDGFRALRDGEQVEYEQITGDKGLSARNVTRIVPMGSGAKDAKSVAPKMATSGAAAQDSTESTSSHAAAEPSPASIPTAAHVARVAASPKVPKL
jgi:cold shock protein